MQRQYLWLIAWALISVVIVEAAEGQISRLRLRQCSRATQRFAEQPVPATRRAEGLSVKRAVALLPDYTRCVVVSRQPAWFDAQQLEQLENSTRPQRELILSLDPDPAKAFGRYLQTWSGSAVAIRESSEFCKCFGKRKTRLVVSGMANYRLPRTGPAGATQSDGLAILLFEQPCGTAWREFARNRPQQLKFGLHHEGSVEFFQDGKHWFALASPHVVIVGDTYSYFQDVVTKAARANANKQTAARHYVDLVDPNATFWFAYFADKNSDGPIDESPYKKSGEPSDWPVHVVEYVPNDEWTLTVWSSGRSPAVRPKWDAESVVERFDQELIPEYNNSGRKSPPLVGHSQRHKYGFEEMRFSVRHYDLETGLFPIFFVGLMGIAVFI